MIIFRKFMLLCCLLALASIPALSSTFYCDPAIGRISNNGSSASPWSTLKQVIDSGKIETRQPVNYPYSWGQPLQTKNAGAPVKAGDTILLRNGYHGDVQILRAFNTDYITIAAQSGQTPGLKRLALTAASKWRIKGLTISPELASATDKITLIAVESHNYSGPTREIIVEDCYCYTASNTATWDTVTWKARSCNGISVTGKQVTIRNNRVKNIDFGISVSADSVLVEGNSVDVFDGDGLRGVANDLMFRNNRITNCIVANGANHDDGFQSWSVGDSGVGTGTVYRVSLIGNTIINYTDPNLPLRGTLQGIGCFDGMFDGWVIENNVIVTDHWHGITLSGARNCRIVNNTVCDLNSVSPGPPWIMIGDHKNGTPSSNCVIRNNLSTDISAGTGVTADHNIEFQNPSDFFVNYAQFDFRLKQGCAAIDSGSSTLAPATDIIGTSRPQGSKVDVGAYEYTASSVINNQKVHQRSFYQAYSRNGVLVMTGPSDVQAPAIRVYDVTGRQTAKPKMHSSGLYFVKILNAGFAVPVIVQ